MWVFRIIRNYFPLNISHAAAFTLRFVTAIAFVSGISLGHNFTQFIAKPHSAIPPGCIRHRCILRESALVGASSWYAALNAMAAGPIYRDADVKEGQASRHIPQWMHRPYSCALLADSGGMASTGAADSSYAASIQTSARLRASNIYDRSTHRSRTTGNFDSGSRMTGAGGKSSRFALQASNGLPLMSIAHAPQLPSAHPHSHAIGVTGFPSAFRGSISIRFRRSATDTSSHGPNRKVSRYGFLSGASCRLTLSSMGHETVTG